jgi:hypothetical protein
VSHACRAVSGQRPHCDRRTCERRFRSRQMGGPGADLAGAPTITGRAAVTAHLPRSVAAALAALGPGDSGSSYGWYGWRRSDVAVRYRCAVRTNFFMLQPVWCSIHWLTAIVAGEHDAYAQPVFPSWLADAAAPRRSPCSTPFAIHDRPPRRCSLFHRRAADVPAAGVSRGPKGKPTPAAPGLYRCQHPFLLVRHRSVRGWAGAANPPIAEESSRQNPATGGRPQVTVRDSSHHNLFELFGVLAGLSLGARNY